MAAIAPTDLQRVLTSKGYAITKTSLNVYKHLFENCTSDHAKTFDLLLKQTL